MYYGNSFNCGRIRTGRAVLVAISIPIFSSQLEKSRDAVSVSNMRAAYAQAQAAWLTGSGDGTGTDGNTDATVTVNKTDKKVTVTGVVIKSQTGNNWSGLAAELPFSAPGDTGANTTKAMVFTYTTEGATPTVTFNQKIAANKSGDQ